MQLLLGIWTHTSWVSSEILDLQDTIEMWGFIGGYEFLMQNCESVMQVVAISR